MSTKEFIAEILENLKQYDTAGVVDRASLYLWLEQGLKKFGQAVTTPQEAIVDIKDGKGKLPMGFHSLMSAYRVEPEGYTCSKEVEPILQKSLIWIERMEEETSWNSCNPCEIKTSEKLVKENIYLDNNLVTFYYNNPIKLNLAKGINRDYVASEYRKQIMIESPYEINIIKKMMQTNFSNGLVYITYYGLDMEDDLPYIPDTSRGYLVEYLEYFLKMKFFERLITNGDDVNVISLLQYYAQATENKFPSAKADVKFNTLTPDSYRKLKMLNNNSMLKYEILLPKA